MIDDWFQTLPGYSLEGTAGAGALPSGVGTVGLDSRTRNALEYFFKRKLDGHFSLSDVQSADIWIVDVDSMEGRAVFTGTEDAAHRQPVIALSINPVAIVGAAHQLRKPIRPQELVDALEKIASNIARVGVERKQRSGPAAPATGTRHQLLSASDNSEEQRTASRLEEVYPFPPATRKRDGETLISTSEESVGFKLGNSDSRTFFGSVPDIDPADPHQVARAQFDPSRYLIGKLFHAIELARDSERAVRLASDLGVITVLPGAGQVLVDMSHNQLRALAVAPLDEERVGYRFVDGVDLSVVPREKIYRLDALLWTSMLLASRGKVPVGTDLNAPVTMKHWPNLTRLEAFPRAPRIDSSVRIAACLCRESVSLATLARVLKIPQRFVFAFFAAASALDLIVYSTDPETTIPNRATFPPSDSGASENHNLFKRILSHLRG